MFSLLLAVRKVACVLVGSAILKMDQRNCIKFRYKNGINCSEVLDIVKIAFGESAISKTRDYE